MSRPKAASRATAANVAASLADILSPARAEASRRNGAKSKGPKTPEGKARSSRNALKHGFRAQQYVVLPEEDAAAFQALEAALIEEFAPEGALQTALARRVVAATWRLERAERMEAELFAHEMHSTFGKAADLGLALIRDCNGARAFDTLLRYRGGTLAELWRALRTLKALQAEAAARSEPLAPEPRLTNRSLMRRKSVGNASLLRPAEPHETPIEPESRANPGDSGRPADRADLRDSRSASALLPPRSPATPPGPARRARPIEPESCKNPGETGRDASSPTAPAPEVEALDTETAPAAGATRMGQDWRAPAPTATPIKPEIRKEPGESRPGHR